MENENDFIDDEFLEKDFKKMNKFIGASDELFEDNELSGGTCDICGGDKFSGCLLDDEAYCPH